MNVEKVNWIRVLNGLIWPGNTVAYPVRDGNCAEIRLGRVVALEKRVPSGTGGSSRRAKLRVVIDVQKVSGFELSGKRSFCEIPARVVKISPDREDEYPLGICTLCDKVVRLTLPGLLSTLATDGYTSYCDEAEPDEAGLKKHIFEPSQVDHG